MAKFETREDVRNKVEWEGGLPDALEYGIRSADLPEDDQELIGAWEEMEEAFSVFQSTQFVVEDLLEPDE